MHETVIANNIIKEAKKYGKVKEIFLEIGELGHVPAQELMECLEKMVKWKINSKEITAEVRCECGFEGHPIILERGHDSFMIECPECQETPKLIKGTDIKIVRVIVD